MAQVRLGAQRKCTSHTVRFRSLRFTNYWNVAFNQSASSDAEKILDDLRDRAHRKIDERKKYSQQSQEAYQRGDGALAKELSNRAHAAGAEADTLNQQASDYIFRENNAQERVTSDEIDLHGQQVEEAERILDQRIAVARAQGQTHLHVIVGKGIHSADHIQKIKPAVERLCQEQGLAYKTEANAGRMYIDLTGNQNLPQQIPPSGQYYGNGEPYGQQYQPQGAAGYQQGGGLTQQQEEEIVSGLAACLKKCCTIM
jgi:DNA-nicking Smr family endonuclease